MSFQTFRDNEQRKFVRYVFLLSGMLLAASVVAVSTGAFAIDVFAPLSALQQKVLFDVRMPRVLMTMITGAGLAICGLSLQSLTRNPLAEPGLIGVSMGAALFASIAILASTLWVFPQWASLIIISLSAFSGAMLTLLLLLAITGVRQSINTLVLILAGVAINAGAATLLGFVSYIVDDETLRVITFWQLGSYAGITWSKAMLASVIVISACVFLYRKHRFIMLIQVGEQHASMQGINVLRLKLQTLCTVALVTAVCVCFTGIVGFVGLVIPHICRMLFGENLRYLYLLAPLAGALLVTSADIGARLLVIPAELPIGLLTSALGVPFFIWLIIREKRKFADA